MNHTEYERLKEQGRLHVFPCAVGDAVYTVIYDRLHEPQCYISESEVEDVSVRGITFAGGCFSLWEDFGKTDFLTRKEAEEAMAEKVSGKLKEYEDLKEQGRLLELPCVIGDYALLRVRMIVPVVSMTVSNDGILVMGKNGIWVSNVPEDTDYCLGYFKTYEEAEKALERM